MARGRVAGPADVFVGGKTVRRIRLRRYRKARAKAALDKGVPWEPWSDIRSLAVYAVVAASLVAAFPAGAADDCAPGTTEVVIDTGAQFITTCVEDGVVAAAEDGEPVTLAVETCPCDYAALLAPRALRRYDAGAGPDCRDVTNGLRLVGTKTRPGGTQVTLLSGLAPTDTNGGKNCRLTFDRGTKTVLDFQMAVTTPGMEDACRASVDAYRAVVPNDDYAALVCPGFE